MTTICRSISLAVLGVSIVTSAARGGDAPLLVSVEVAPGVDVGPADVRQVVATELGAPVVGSREPAAAAATDILLVALDPREIRMSLRAGGAPVVSRTIPVPLDRPGRLRSIGWLAGNLVRDQVSPIVATRDAPSAVADTRPATEPPALPVTPPADVTAPAAVVASRPSPPPDSFGHSTWAVTAAGGYGVPFYNLGLSIPADYAFSSTYRVDVQHQTSPESLLFGVSLRVGPDRHFFGAAAFVGSGWYRRRWFLEGDLGLGVEALIGEVRTLTITNSSAANMPVSETTTSFEPIPGLFARAQGTVGAHVAPAFDLVAQLGAHLSSSGEYSSFVSPTLGVRLRLP